MIRSGDEYRASIRDGREVWMNGERITDVTAHPAFKPLVDARARIYDMAHDPATQRPDELPGRRQRRAQRGRTEAAAHPRGLGAEAPRGGRRDGRPGRRRDPRRRRDGRRDVVAVRRPGRAERGRPAVLGQHRAPHPAGAARRSLPRLRQHRSQGRPLQAPAGPGPRHAAAPRPRDRQRHRRARRQVRDRRGLCQPGLRQADHRQLGRQRAVRLRARLHLRHGRARRQAHLPHRASPAARRPRTTRCPTASTRWTRWSSSTTSRSPGRTCCSTGTRAPPPSSGRRCTATAPSRSCSGSSGSPTC